MKKSFEVHGRLLINPNDMSSSTNQMIPIFGWILDGLYLEMRVFVLGVDFTIDDRGDALTKTNAHGR